MSAALPAASEGIQIRIAMPGQLRDLAKVRGEVEVVVVGPVTVAVVLDALEMSYPTLVGALRDRHTGRRRPMIRICADGEDYTDATAETVLPDAVLAGRQPLRLIGAVAGG